jgi:conjugative relaxase-like TrwC/TraI family protein
MLSMTRVSSGQAGAYYSQDDYYLESGQSEWYGNGANNFGLNGKVTEDSFSKLIIGKGPNDEFSIANGGKDYKHTAGVDLTFSAPKSVSIAGLVLDDKRILEAHNKAVNETMSYIQNNLMQVRLKTEGYLLSEKTDNLIAAKFQHVASRELDPQLHTHCLVFNASQKNNGDWRAVNYKSMFDNKLMLGQVYRNELAKNLQELGYKIETDSRGFFELKGIDSSLSRAFSTRSEQIKARVEELRSKYPNANESELKAMATLDSRRTKDEPSFSELKAQWDTRLNEYGINKESLKELMTEPSLASREVKPDIEKIISNAVRVHTATEAVVSKENILKTAMEGNMVGYSVKDFETALINNKEVKSYQDNKYFTTKELAALETGIVQNIRSQQGTQSRVLDKESIATGITDYEFKNGFKLTADQKQAVEHILTSRDQVIAIQGDAGTGKTTMLDCVNDIVTTQNINVDLRGLSFTGKAAHEIEQASNIKSQTIASFIHEKTDSKNQSTMFVVDEASMLSIKDMDALLDKVGSNNRMVLIGDTKQLQSIGAGKIFSTLQNENAINTVTMKESKRQVNEVYRESTKHMAEKSAGRAIDILDEHGKISEINNREDRLNAIVDRYCKNPENTILVTATNVDRQELNNMIRNELHRQGKIGDSHVGLLVREPKGLTEEQKGAAQNYAKNDLIIVNSNSFGNAGLEGNITAIDKEKNTIAILDRNMNNHEINLSQYSNDISVYKEQLREFTTGEKVVFLKNDKSLGVSNGQTAKIISTEPNGKAKLLMETGQEKTINLKTQYKYVAHGYALTDYKSQGQTAKEVIYHADTTKSVNFNRAYVGMTRGKEDIAIYTDDKNKFKEMTSRDQQKTSVHEFEAKEKSMPVSQVSQNTKIQEKEKHNYQMSH